ncbi:MAG: HAMP domain-containing protein, partial [Deltaproteobacteria bacterium]|nr:HAMP domain-containing protein [Deltaproteobacteria bacterium]
MKLFHKLFLNSLVFVLLILLVGYLALSTSQQALKEYIGKSSASSATEALNKIEQTIDHKIELFQEYSRNSMLRQTLSESNQKFDELDDIQTYITKTDQEWTSALKEEITPFMQKLLGNQLSVDLIEKIKFYEEKYGYRVFGEVFVTNRYGANIVQTGKTSDYRQDDEGWWQKAKRDGVYIADVEYDKSAAMHSIDIGIRVDDKAGSFLGVVKVVLNLKEMCSIIEEIEASSGFESNTALLINREGTVISSTHHNFGEHLYDDQFFKKMDSDQGYFEAKTHRGDKGKALLSYAVSKGYGNHDGFGRILLVEHRTDEIFEPVAKLRNSLLIISIMVTIFAILVSFFFSRHISDPVTKLKNFTIEIGKGKLDVGIEVESHDEIGQLAGSFMKMVENLKKTTTSIDRLNKEIVERKEAEAALKKSHEELEQTLQKLKETQVQILQSEKMASIGQLAAGVAHEINNPTGFISSNLNVLAGYDTDIKSLIEQYRAIVSDLKAGAATSANEGRSSISERLSHIAELEKEVDIDFILSDTPNLIKESQEGTDRIKKIVIGLKDFVHPGEHKLNYADINKNMESTLNVVWNELKYKARVVKEYG